MRLARLEYLALLDSADITDALERARPDDALEINVRLRATDGGLFDEAVSGRAALALESREPWVRAEIARCQRYATIEAAVPGERALALLRSTERVLSALAGEGDLTWALDRSTAVWRAPAELAPERPFSVEDHFLVVVEAVERAPGAGHLVRSRGLAKFARPDVGMRAPRAEAEEVAELVRAVARRGAAGELFLPGRRLPGTNLAPWPRSDDCLRPAPPDEAPLCELREGGLSLLR